MSDCRPLTGDRDLIVGGKVAETGKNAARERSRVKDLRNGFSSLQSLIPNVPPDTKLSKLDILLFATDYIKHLSTLLEDQDDAGGTAVRTATVSQPDDGHRDDKYLHPVKKWPMRARLFAKRQRMVTQSLPFTSGTDTGTGIDGVDGASYAKSEEASSCASSASPTASQTSSSPPLSTSGNEWESMFDDTDLDNGCFLLQVDASSSLFDFNECAM